MTSLNQIWQSGASHWVRTSVVITAIPIVASGALFLYGLSDKTDGAPRQTEITAPVIKGTSECDNSRGTPVCLEFKGGSDVNRSGNITGYPNELIVTRIEYKNTGSVQVDDVVVRLKTDSRLRYVEGTTRVWNSRVPLGSPIEGNALLKDGLNLGSYGIDGNVYVEVAITVDSETEFSCGSTQSSVSAEIQIGNTVVQDQGVVQILRKCDG
jgi:hypothetical protein